MTNFLAVYLRDHAAGAAAGVRRFHRTARHHSDVQTREALSRLALEVEQDCDSLVEIMATLGIQPSRVKSAGARVAETVGALTPNGRLWQRSPLTDLIELEALAMAVSGKRHGWRTLSALITQLPALDPAELAALEQRAADQHARLTELHTRAASQLPTNRT